VGGRLEFGIGHFFNPCSLQLAAIKHGEFFFPQTTQIIFLKFGSELNASGD
tara:strand:- start:6209 stop:6361 length:153 start_codon:yes stop_codon:yes gene_type:complete